MVTNTEQREQRLTPAEVARQSRVDVSATYRAVEGSERSALRHASTRAWA
jgi:hypothetical protein